MAERRLSAGDLNQRITLQQSSTSPDGAGQPIPTWEDLVTGVPAQVMAVAGGETLRGRQVAADVSTLITIRFRSGITSRMRVQHEGRTLGILRTVDPDGHRWMLELHCREEA